MIFGEQSLVFIVIASVINIYRPTLGNFEVQFQWLNLDHTKFDKKRLFYNRLKILKIVIHYKVFVVVALVQGGMEVLHMVIGAVQPIIDSNVYSISLVKVIRHSTLYSDISRTWFYMYYYV